MRFRAALSKRRSVETEGQQFQIITVHHPPYLMLFCSQSEFGQTPYELPWSVLWKNYLFIFFFCNVRFQFQQHQYRKFPEHFCTLERYFRSIPTTAGACLELSNRHISLLSSSVYLAAITVSTFELVSFSFSRKFSWHVKCEQKHLCNKARVSSC